MICAALDTSQYPSLAIADGAEILFQGSHTTMGRHSDRDLVSWLQAGFRDAGVGIGDVTRWRVGTGPGSFSGIRVGIALVKGICAATDTPLQGTPSSVALALGLCLAQTAEVTLAVLHDARRGQVIGTRFHWSGGASPVLRQEGQAAILEPVALNGPALRTRLLLTSHPAVVDSLPEDVRQRVIVVPLVDARWLLEAGRFEHGEGSVDAEAALEPVYVRPAVFVEPRSPRRTQTVQDF